VLNHANAQVLADAFGADTAAWMGRNVEVFADPSIMFRGKRTGGVRVRALPLERKLPARKSPSVPASEAKFDDPLAL
jgi:hypothetical protein